MALSATNITTSLVKSTLGESTFNVGSLCTSNKINRWSKYKPVILPQDCPDRSKDWWKAESGNCGLSFKTFTNVGQIVSNVDAGTSDWEYSKPYGGSASPYRLADFGGYEHSAICPIGELDVPSIAQIGQGKTLDVFVPYSKNIQTSVNLTDIGGASGLQSMYFGAILYNTTTKSYQWQTTSTTLGSGGVCQIQFDLSGILAGTYKVYPFLTDIKKTNPIEPDVAGDFVPMPSEVGVGKSITLQSASPSYDYTVTITKGVLGEYSYVVKFNNTSDSSLTFKNIYLGLYQRKDGQLVVGDEQPIYNQTVTVPGKTSKTYSGTVLAIENEFKMWRLTFTDNTNTPIVKTGYL